MGRERNLKRGQKESTEGVGTLAEYGLLEIRGTEHFNANKITFVKCLLKNEKSLSALAGRLDYLGKSSFSLFFPPLCSSNDRVGEFRPID